METECSAESAGLNPGMLVASSNADFRRHVVEGLRASHWPAREAMGGAEALSKLETGDCHILLLDQWLPDLDVTELVGRV